MREVKDTQRSQVRIGYDGRVHKNYSGPHAAERYQNEVRVLNYLAQRKCPFVPKILLEDPEKLYVVTTNCGNTVNQISAEKTDALFAELRDYGVEHGDAMARNITYSGQLGRFCIIDFELIVLTSIWSISSF